MADLVVLVGLAHMVDLPMIGHFTAELLWCVCASCQ